MTVGQHVSLTAMAQRADGSPHDIPVEGVVEGIDATQHGQRLRVRDADGWLTVVDACSVERRRLTAEEYAGTWED